MALVKLEEGPVITAQLTDIGADPMHIGMPVEMVTRKLKSDDRNKGILIYTLSGAGGYKFRPVMAAAI